MKLTRILRAQHLGWHFKKFWAAKKAMKVVETGLEKALTAKNIPIVKAEDVIKQVPLKYEKIEIVDCRRRAVKYDETHPNWHDTPLLSYKDNNVLLEGLTQAKILTNTVELKEGLPDSIQLEKIAKSDNEVIKHIILASHAFDAEQKKLPKLKDPERPAWVFPRVYGITQNRATKLLLSRLFNFIENRCELGLVTSRVFIDDLLFSFPFNRDSDLIQFELKSDILLTSAQPLKPISGESGHNFDLPDIFPIKPTISLNEENIYELKTIYPIGKNVAKSHPHTLFAFFNKEEVGNIFEEEVTEEQIFGRSLLKTFTVAATYARTQFGENVGALPRPVTVQCVQTDGRQFHFGIFQLNTLNLQDEIRNFWYQSKYLPLFEFCGYKTGKPLLEGYNDEIIKYLTSFYNNM